MEHAATSFAPYSDDETRASSSKSEYFWNSALISLTHIACIAHTSPDRYSLVTKFVSAVRAFIAPGCVALRMFHFSCGNLKLQCNHDRDRLIKETTKTFVEDDFEDRAILIGRLNLRNT